VTAYLRRRLADDVAGDTFLAAWHRLDGVPADPLPWRVSMLFRAGEFLVMKLPVTPQLRGAAYRMLAGLDGVRSVGPVTDRRGRAGTGVGYDYTGPQDEDDLASPAGPMRPG
jgi:hypothetical protein